MTGASGSSSYAQLATAFYPTGLAHLALLAAITSWLFMKTGMPNAWMLESLVASMVATISGITLSAIPHNFSVPAQLLIGKGSQGAPSRRQAFRLGLGILPVTYF